MLLYSVFVSGGPVPGKSKSQCKLILQQGPHPRGKILLTISNKLSIITSQ